MLQSALDYLSWGFAVFPLSANSKIPMKGTAGVKDASKSPDKVRAWWLATPHANVGVALGAASGVVAIDLDKGATRETLKAFPRTVTARSKNGWHLYYRYTDGLTNTQLVKEGYNATLRSTGYYVVGVGSTVDGWEYVWESDEGGELAPGECQIAELPAEFLPKVKKLYGENTRHQMFVETATAMRAKGHTPEEVLAELHRRNREDCNPPKQNCEKELQDICNWVFQTVSENPEQVAQRNSKVEKRNLKDNVDGVAEENIQHYVQPLGYDDSAYYYTSSSNKQIVKLSASAHTSQGLLHLMPYQWWESRYSKGVTKDGVSKGIDWTQAASDLLQACRDEGIFDPKKVRGLGCWREYDWLNQRQKLVIHLGDRLWMDGKELPLNALGESRNIYELRQRLPSPVATQASRQDLQALMDAANALAWSDPCHAMLFVGGLSVLRICGALKWRPMLWLTGPSGSGKSTVVEMVIKNVAGPHGVYILGNSSEAGIRQRLKASAQPVIFDEAETDDKRSGNRMKAVLELVRQASSDSDAQIVKGTSDGKGHAFKVNSMFVMSSIQVNLTSEQDINRFTLLELRRNNPNPWKDVSRKLDAITEDLADRLFSYMISKFETLQSNQAKLEEAIAKTTDMRTAQQYSILLAGYVTVKEGTVISDEQAQKLCESVGLIKAVHQDKEDGEQELECLNWLKLANVDVEVYGNRERVPMSQLILKATGSQEYLDVLRKLGIDVDDKNVYVASRHAELDAVYRNTRWEGGLWSRTLSRLPNAAASVRRSMGLCRLRTTAIPLLHFATVDGVVTVQAT